MLIKSRPVSYGLISYCPGIPEVRHILAAVGREYRRASCTELRYWVVSVFGFPVLACGDCCCCVCAGVYLYPPREATRPAHRARRPLPSRRDARHVVPAVYPQAGRYKTTRRHGIRSLSHSSHTVWLYPRITVTASMHQITVICLFLVILPAVLSYPWNSGEYTTLHYI